ncbi:MAG TPA: LacI family DNA-binding transcriptional regulator [Armatimonadota bacterium]|jgi:LacI family transcriptional regulator
MTSLRQLAKLAGVSHMTVMRVLRQEPYVRAEIRQRVLELAELYAYRPAPKAEASAKPPLIGCLVPDIASSVYGRLVKGVLGAAFAESYQVIMLESNHQVTHSCKALEVFAEHQVQGVVLGPGHADIIPTSFLLELWGQGIHVVDMCERSFPQSIDIMLRNEDAQMEIAVRHLYDLGHRAFAFVGHQLHYASQALQAFRRSMERRALPAAHFDIFECSDAQALAAFRALSYQPTAIVAWSDYVAAQLCRTLFTAGFHLPHDVSIVGCGNLQLSQYNTPPLTTVEQSYEETGRQGVELLIRRIQSGLAPGEYAKETHEIPPKLIIRASCTRPAGSRSGGSPAR